MGSCYSVHKNPDSAIKVKLVCGSKSNNGKISIPSSPVKDHNTKPIINGEHPNPSRVHDFSSKEETFFDSRAWLDSDCEDDFYSVNGDFTPSCGSTPLHPSRRNTPLHQSISVPQVNKALLEEKTPKSKPETSPTEKKKKLAELFQDSFGNEEDIPNILNNQHKPNGRTGLKATPVNVPSKSPHGTPHMSGGNSVTSSERTANGSGKLEKEKHSKSVQCCLPVPSLISSSSFNDRRKTSPVIARG